MVYYVKKNHGVLFIIDIYIYVCIIYLQLVVYNGVNINIHWDIIYLVGYVCVYIYIYIMGYNYDLGEIIIQLTKD